MKLTDTSGGDFEQAPTGAQIARCIKVIDLGTQESIWEGKVNHKRQLIIMWELPKCLMEQGEHAGKPFAVSRFYTASLGEKANLRHDLVAWRGHEFTPEELAGFDPKNVLGKTCMLGITANDKGKSRVTTVMQMPKGMEAPDQVNESVYFSLDDVPFDQKTFERLTKGIKAMIEASPEYQSIGFEPVAPRVSGHFDDLENDIPF